MSPTCRQPTKARTFEPANPYRTPGLAEPTARPGARLPPWAFGLLVILPAAAVIAVSMLFVLAVPTALMRIDLGVAPSSPGLMAANKLGLSLLWGIIGVAAVAIASLFASRFLGSDRLRSGASLLIYAILTTGLTSFTAWVAYSVIGRVPFTMPGLFGRSHFLW